MTTMRAMALGGQLVPARLSFYGAVDVERVRAWRREGRSIKVLIDGADVTDDCYWADDEMGLVKVWKRDATGHAYRDKRTGEAAQTKLMGQVEIRLEPQP
jgi:hypothetical protein